jgi:8-oxo-dGTP diphosphatase
MENSQYFHEVVITAIIQDGDKYLIVRRSPKKKRFPKMWTVPGGRLEASDYLALPKDTEAYWYNVLERTLAREIKEEARIEVNNAQYLTSLARVHEDGSPSIVISCTADYISGDVKVDGEENDQFAWVTIDEAKDYDLIDGIFQEFVQIERSKNGPRALWENITAWPTKK